MRIRLNAFIGRENIEIVRLLVDGETVPENVVTRVVFRFGGYCLDTDNPEHAGVISLIDNATRVQVKLGLVPGLKPSTDCPLFGSITVYDAASPEGIAWYRITVRVVDWKVCGDD